MNNAAFKDPKKLADARALAKSFKGGEGSNDPKKRSLSSRQRRAVDAVRSVEIKKPVPPSQRNYDGNVLKNGWQIRGFSPNIPVMSSAMDFLYRADQAPETSPAPDVAVDYRISSTAPTSSNSLVTTDLETPRHIRPRELGTNKSHTAVNNQKSNDERNAEQLAELLDSFSFKESTESSGNASASLLETFLALLAEHTDLPPELEDAKESCVKRSEVIDGDVDESETVKVPPMTELETSPILNYLDQQGSKSRPSMSLPKENTQLQPWAPAFVPYRPHTAALIHESEHKLLPFPGQFDELNADGFTGVWPPMENIVSTVPVTNTVWMPVQQVATNHPADQANVFAIPAKQMKGLSASMWAARTASSA
ncbi:hypothetical protein E4U21_005313 [Claviceps maximensis]|nr:hypothetical protein E4U21_005313 [Claviceps maximensis]